MINRNSSFNENRNRSDDDKYSKYGVIVAALALFFSLITSLYSMYATREQLKMSKMQIDSTNAVNAHNEKKEIINSQQESEKYSADTTRTGNRDRQQLLNFQRQTEINEAQLKAIQIQANTALQQFSKQVAINKQILFEGRPIFSLINVKRDSSSNIASFEIENIGKRPATLIYSKAALYNEKYNVFNNNPGIESFLEMNDKIRVNVNLYNPKPIFEDSNTMYFISLLYKDISTGETKIFKKFFRWQYQSPGVAQWGDIDISEIKAMKKRSKTSKFKF